MKASGIRQEARVKERSDTLPSSLFTLPCEPNKESANNSDASSLTPNPCERSESTVYSLTPFTQLDYPGHMACIVWLAGCNMRCPYCYNPEIIYGKGDKPWHEIKSFLKKRQGMLDAVVFSGGECTLHPDLEFFCQEAKELGYKVKIDTNGSHPEHLRSLIQKDLVDMISLDFKAPSQSFKLVSSSNHYQALIQTLIFLIAHQKTSFEVRTTVHTDLLNEQAINEIIYLLKSLNYQGTYYLQNYLATDHTLGCLPAQKRLLEISKLSSAIPIQLRNFPLTENVFA